MSTVEFLAECLQKHLRPATFPTAIRMVEEGEPLPDRVKRPREDLGIQSAICQGFSFSRKYGWPIAIDRDDLSCPLAKAVFGLAPEISYFEEGHACAGMYTCDAAAGQKTEEQTPRFAFGRYQAIVMAPLHRCNFHPHVILIYGTPGQVMRLVTAALWKRGGRITSSFAGRIDCADAVIETMKTDRPQVILPCYGDRIFAQSDDHEMAFSLPASWMEETVEGFEGTHKGGVRYPVPSFLKYQGQFPPHYEKMNQLWRRMDKE